MTQKWIVPSLLFTGGLLALAALVATPFPAALAQEEGGSAEEGQPDDDLNPEQLERRLDEIERLLERAEQQGNEERIDQLRDEGERLIDRLEELERNREDEGDDFEEQEALEREQREIELHRLHLEMEHLHLELQLKQQEASLRRVQLASDPTAAAAGAIQLASAHLEEEELLGFLDGILEETEDPAIARLVRSRLAELNFQYERREIAKEQLRELILKR